MKNLKSEEVQGHNLCLPSKKEITPFYETLDLYLSALLKAKGVDFIESDRRARRTLFLFENAGNIHELVNSYFNDGSIGALGYKAVILDCARFRILRPIIPKQGKWLLLRSRRKVTRLDLRGLLKSSVRPSEQA